ncbi:hypothetical protein Tco_0765118 [Tanacetum coccineum]
MRIDELHKFSDGTLDDALNDRLKGIRMEYLPKIIWRQSDRERAKAMIQAIDKQLKSRRIMRSLEKFVALPRRDQPGLGADPLPAARHSPTAESPLCFLSLNPEKKEDDEDPVEDLADTLAVQEMMMRRR